MSGILPKGWAETAIGELGDWRGGGTPSKAHDAYWNNGSIPWVSPKDMKRDFLDDAEDHITEAAVEGSATQLIPAQSVLIVTRSGILKHSLPVAINARDAAINQDLKALTPYHGIKAEFVAGQFRADAQGILSDCAKAGTTVDSVDFDKLKARTFRLAPAAEQHRIVEKIDSLFSRSTRARDELAHIPRLIKRYRQAVLDAAFRGDLTADWRVENPEPSGELLRRDLLALRAEASATGSKKFRLNSDDFDYSSETELPELPASWTWMPVAALATAVVDGVHKKPVYVETGVPFVTVRNLTAGPGLTFDGCRFVTDEDHQEFTKRTRPEFGDILITKDGTLGVVRAVRTNEKFSIFVSVALVKPVDRRITDYLELAFQSPTVQDQMGGVGSGLLHIHLVDLRKDLIPVAPQAERQEIVRRLRQCLNQIDRIEEEALSATKMVSRLDQSILDKAFAGELVPQDPTDEPANALLARIKAAREEAPPKTRGPQHPSV